MITTALISEHTNLCPNRDLWCWSSRQTQYFWIPEDWTSRWSTSQKLRYPQKIIFRIFCWAQRDLACPQYQILPNGANVFLQIGYFYWSGKWSKGGRKERVMSVTFLWAIHLIHLQIDPVYTLLQVMQSFFIKSLSCSASLMWVTSFNPIAKSLSVQLFERQCLNTSIQILIHRLEAEKEHLVTLDGMVTGTLYFNHTRGISLFCKTW